MWFKGSDVCTVLVLRRVDVVAVLCLGGVSPGVLGAALFAYSLLVVCYVVFKLGFAVSGLAFGVERRFVVLSVLR